MEIMPSLRIIQPFEENHPLRLLLFLASPPSSTPPTRPSITEPSPPSTFPSATDRPFPLLDQRPLNAAAPAARPLSLPLAPPKVLACRLLSAKAGLHIPAKRSSHSSSSWLSNSIAGSPCSCLFGVVVGVAVGTKTDWWGWEVEEDEAERWGSESVSMLISS